MDLKDAIKNRHSVRSYDDRKIEGDLLLKLKSEIEECNRESGLRIQLVTDNLDAFGGFMARYGKFINVKNYIALIGEKSYDLDEKVGYYGERLALKAQQLGLNTCWVAMTFSRKKSGCKLLPNEKLVCVLALGYGKTQGVAHKSKPIKTLCSTPGEMPEWFKSGMEAALLAPTAMNQQKFLFTLLNPNIVIAKSTGGFYSKVDLGIVKYHFEVGAGKDNFVWYEE